MGNGQVFLPIDGAKTKPAKTVELSVSWCEKKYMCVRNSSKICNTFQTKLKTI